MYIYNYIYIYIVFDIFCLGVGWSWWLRQGRNEAAEVGADVEMEMGGETETEMDEH
jgi:hypothetical protein